MYDNAIVYRNLDSEPVGYPMSKFVQQLPHSALSYEAREMACHFADFYIQRLKGTCNILSKTHLVHLIFIHNFSI